MLSTSSLHQYPPAFGHLSSPNSIGHDQHFSQQHLGSAGLDALAHSSHYALHFQQQQRHTLAQGKGLVKQRHHPYSSSPIAAASRTQRDAMTQDRGGRSSTASAPVRRRISRACDQCNQLRTKCDGKAPCAHCVEFGLACEYVRERKKRGKASRKDIAMQQAAAAAASGSNEDSTQASPRAGEAISSADQESDEGTNTNPGHAEDSKSSSQLPTSVPPPRSNVQNAMYSNIAPMARTISLSDVDSLDGSVVDHNIPNVDPRLSNGVAVGMNEYGQMDRFHQSMMHQHHVPNEHQMMPNGGVLPHHMINTNNMQAYGENPYMLSPTSQPAHHNAFRIPTGESPMSAGYLANGSVGGSPGWLSLGSPTAGAGLYGHPPPVNPQSLRYPVLQPLLPHLGNLLPTSIACDLLEMYFQSSSSAFMRPLSPYVLGYVLRKRSFLCQMNPRICSPALLASMLWIGAQTSDSPFLTTPPSARGKICQKLLELTIGLLRPLIHSPIASNEGSPSYAANTVINGVALGGFGVALPSRREPDVGSPGATGGLDDVITYMHLAIVVSASEYKAASLRWWNAAWSLARELKLGRELPPNPISTHRDHNDDHDEDAPGEVDVDMNHHGNSQPNPPGTYSEEEREERRRIWWLLYTMDRHLALCYNRPLFLLDIECDGLFQPVDDAIWQLGDYYDPDSIPALSDPTSPFYRRRGPTFQCTGHSIFGFFLPLMTILGEIVDLNHARNHPRFGLRYRNGTEWDDQAAEIALQLEAYGRSLQEFEHRFAKNIKNDEAANGMDMNGEVHSPSAHSVHSSGSRAADQLLQTKLVVAYGTHVMHTLHILLNGKWDPISLLDDNDLWISSQAFVSATGHAVDAARAIRTILDYDPDLSFMPFFFGIYLLQGSFLLLLIADKLREAATPNIVEACETIVRAHEVCVVTLNTEYQRNFRKVMRSALMQVRGLGDWEEQQLRRREVLSLYRWTGDGSGLAL